MKYAEIAKAANVSVSTVSKVMGGSSDVPREMEPKPVGRRERVLGLLSQWIKKERSIHFVLFWVHSTKMQLNVI